MLLVLRYFLWFAYIWIHKKIKDPICNFTHLWYVNLSSNSTDKIVTWKPFRRQEHRDSSGKDKQYLSKNTVLNAKSSLFCISNYFIGENYTMWECATKIYTQSMIHYDAPDDCGCLQTACFLLYFIYLFWGVQCSIDGINPVSNLRGSPDLLLIFNIFLRLE